MKKFVSICIILSLLGSRAKAQEQYVEVLVSDTVLAEPQEWTVFLSIQKTYADVQYDTSGVVVPKMDEKKGTSLDDLKAVVTKYNGEVVTSVVSKPGSRSSYDNEGSLTATFRSREAMERFMKVVDAIDDVSAQIFAVDLPDISGPQNRLYAKLMAAAKQRAATLSQISGKTLGGVVSISEVTESEINSFKKFFETIIQIDSKSELARTWLNANADKLKMERSLKVRFAFK